MPGPLQDVRVIELGHALAGPFAGVLLADFGADVVKVEPVGSGDSLRAMGPQLSHSSLWWSVTGRNKRSVAIDFKTARGRELVQELVRSADVVVENFRPGVLERAGLGWEELREINPQLVMLRVSGFGQDGPYRDRGGFGKIAEAFSGATHLTGHPDESPVHPGYSLGDTTAGLMGAFGVLLALRERDRNGQGQVVDLSLYEPLLRMIEWQLPLYQQTGTVPARSGLTFPFDGAFITDICETKDGSRIVISAATADSVNRLRELLRSDGAIGAEVDSGRELVDGLRAWVAARTRDDALEKLEAERLVAGSVHTTAEIMNDPHVAARGNIATVPTPEDGEIMMPGVTPRLTATPGQIRWAGPRLGEHTDEVLGELLGLADDTIADLKERSVIQ